MLVLTRKIDQAITLSDGTVITLISIRGKQAKIGIHAPAHVRIFRNEIYNDNIA